MFDLICLGCQYLVVYLYLFGEELMRVVDLRLLLHVLQSHQLVFIQHPVQFFIHFHDLLSHRLQLAFYLGVRHVPVFISEVSLDQIDEGRRWRVVGHLDIE